LVSTPPPPPPPPPPPTYPHVFPGVTTTTNFAVVGAQGATIPTTIAALDTTNFAVRYDAGVDAYIVDLPYLPEGKFLSNGSNNDFWFGGIEGNCCAVITMLKPFPTTTRIQLTYTTYATFYDYDFHDFAPFGVFAFGTATPAGSVPTTGSATYDAMVAGLTIDRGFDVNGSATLHFDFGAGTLAGSMTPTMFSQTASATVSLGTYTFVNTVFGVGHTTFSGDLSHVGFSTLGSFNGLFTGPAAQELMARWSAPYENPDTHAMQEMFGIWVGKKP